MAVTENIMQTWQDTYTVRRVFGEPIAHDGVTVIPVARVAGGGGGGAGPEGEAADAPEASGGGFGGMAKPAGVFVITPDTVEWKPAVDVTALGMAGIVLAGLIAIVFARAFGDMR